MRMQAAKQLTRQKVQAVLRKAGFTRSEWERSGMIRWWGSWSRGYHVPTYTDEILVNHHGDAVRGDYDAQMDLYAAALESAGIEVERRHGYIVCRGFKG